MPLVSLRFFFLRHSCGFQQSHLYYTKGVSFRGPPSMVLPPTIPLPRGVLSLPGCPGVLPFLPFLCVRFMCRRKGYYRSYYFYTRGASTGESPVRIFVRLHGLFQKGSTLQASRCSSKHPFQGQTGSLSYYFRTSFVLVQGRSGIRLLYLFRYLFPKG